MVIRRHRQTEVYNILQATRACSSVPWCVQRSRLATQYTKRDRYKLMVTTARYSICCVGELSETNSRVTSCSCLERDSSSIKIILSLSKLLLSYLLSFSLTRCNAVVFLLALSLLISIPASFVLLTAVLMVLYFGIKFENVVTKAYIMQ